MFNCVSCERFFIVHAFDRARAKLTIRKLLGLRRSYSFASTLAHRLNFVVGPTLALLLDVDVRPSFEFRRWPNHYGCVGRTISRSLLLLFVETFSFIFIYLGYFFYSPFGVI